MHIQKLTLTNVRTFSHVEFTFQPGMNLLVGINGAGKSTVLDALASIMSFALRRFTPSDSPAFSPNESDIALNQEELKISLELLTPDFPISCELGKTKAKPRASFSITPSNDTVLNIAKSRKEQPFAVFFSTQRAYSIDREASYSKSEGDYQFAYADALNNRSLNVREFAQWLLVQETLQKEGLAHVPFRLANMSRLIELFLDNYTNLHVVQNPNPTLMLDKNGSEIDIRYLSDGERNILAMLFDLARRLTQANPHLENPIQEGKAIVLVDELDLHLHPSWQRTIVDRLTKTFPNCQFICTTHSPQIIGEVSPAQIILIMDGQVQRPNQSLGMDTNWILRHLMGAPERDTETMQKLHKIETLIEAEEFDAAEAKINKLRDALGEFPELVRLQTQIDMIDFWADEVDDEDDGE